MHATIVTLWLQVVQPLANVHETKWTPHVKRQSDVAQSCKSSDYTSQTHVIRNPRQYLVEQNQCNAKQVLARPAFSF